MISSVLPTIFLMIPPDNMHNVQKQQKGQLANYHFPLLLLSLEYVVCGVLLLLLNWRTN